MRIGKDTKVCKGIERIHHNPEAYACHKHHRLWLWETGPQPMRARAVALADMPPWRPWRRLESKITLHIIPGCVILSRKFHCVTLKKELQKQKFEEWFGSISKLLIQSIHTIPVYDAQICTIPSALQKSLSQSHAWQVKTNIRIEIVFLIRNCSWADSSWHSNIRSQCENITLPFKFQRLHGGDLGSTLKSILQCQGLIPWKLVKHLFKMISADLGK